MVRFVDVLSSERPMWLLLVAALLSASGYCHLLFSFDFLVGTSPTWDNAVGVVRNSWADMPTALSGYFYFVRDNWHLPLFQVAALGGAKGTNIIFTDSIPLVALFGRILYRLTGQIVNLYGAWTALCFIASAVSMTWLVAILGQRSIASTVASTIAGLCMPALLFRWGHLPLMAQFEIVLALIFAATTKRSCRPHRNYIAAILLCLLALWTNAYLFVMVGGIVVTSMGQALLDRQLSLRAGSGMLAGLVIVILGTILLSGCFAEVRSLGDIGFGFFSMNLLSPIAAQMSGVLPWRRGILDATGGQYEGFGYLGFGLLLLLCASLPALLAEAARLWQRYTLLIVLLGLYTVVAVSNRAYIGAWLALDFPLPNLALQVAGIFRSSGRFAWPLLYSLSTFAIVATARSYGRVGAILLLVASFLQWVDVGPLRTALALSAAAPAPLPLDATVWRSVIARHDYIRVLPSFDCLVPSANWGRQVAMEVQLLAALVAVPTNTVYAARRQEECLSKQDIVPLAGAREMRIYLHGTDGIYHLTDGSYGPGQCGVSASLDICTTVLNEADIQTILRTVETDKAARTDAFDMSNREPHPPR